MPALTLKEETPTSLTLESNRVSRISSFVTLAVLVAVAISILPSFIGPALQDLQFALIAIVFFGAFTFNTLYNAFSSTRVAIDRASHLATRTTSFLGFAIKSSEFQLDKVSSVVVHSRLPVMTAQPSARAVWNVSLQSGEDGSFLVNSLGTYKQMRALGEKVAALVGRPLEDEREQASTATETVEYQPIRDFSGGGGSYAPPIAVPSPLAGGRPTSQLPEKEYMADEAATEIESSESPSSQQAPLAPTMPTMSPAQSDVGMPSIFSTEAISGAPSTPLGMSGASSYSTASAMNLPDQAPMEPITATSAPGADTVSTTPTQTESEDSEATAPAPSRQRSIQELQKAIEENPTDSDAYHALGRQLAARRAFDAAIEAYQNAMRLDPANSDLQNDLGVLYYWRGDFKRAEATFRRAIGLDPFSGVQHYNLGQVLMRTGRRTEAVQEFSRAIQNAASDAESQLYSRASRGDLGNLILSPSR